MIEQHPVGVAVRMRQGRNALGVAILSLGVLVVSWWFGPYAPRPAVFDGVFYWIWSGFWGLAVVAGLLGAVHREDWIIADREVVVTTSFAGRRRTRRSPSTRPLGLRLELRPGTGEHQPAFPWLVHVLDDQRNISGLYLQLQRSGSVDRLLETLRMVLALDVDDPTESRRTTG